ncbi:hypothetical protein [Rhodopseudomonas pseudopalustris]|uniref:Uncharacterized protein n=1 Tax=Rhodopseudomonas pseudopalustris TaxID=1513892 RepID=A0A1H8V7Q1_9BRAD|nr:hypothetical protein [Rhodopseudomonas pseudopalustris]SEP11465.1 hypothetical protein SAMN05444123_108106 [Rhodopseudomonas pseudopalustris]
MTIADIKQQIDGPSAANAAAVVRKAREELNQRRLALVEEAADLTKQLAEAEGADRPNVKAATNIRALREAIHADCQAVQEAACEMNLLLLSIEGEPQPASSVKPEWSIKEAN